MPKITLSADHDGKIVVGPFGSLLASMFGALASPSLVLDQKTKRYTGVTGSGIVLAEGRIGVMVPILDRDGVIREVTINYSVSRPAITESEAGAVAHNADLSTAKKAERDSAVEARIKLITEAAEKQVIASRKAEIDAYQSVGQAVVSAVTNVAVQTIAGQAK